MSIFGKRKTIELIISVVIEQDEEGYYAFAPALKGLHVGGDTLQDVKKHAADAIIAYLKSIFKHGDPLPVGPDLTVREASNIPKTAFLENFRIQCNTLSMFGPRLRALQPKS